jgi:branched-chain amino acid transport system substrate-binding protein
VLHQNDDFGKDYLIGLREGLGDKADKMIVATKTYETTDPTVDSQIVALDGSGADVLLTAVVPKFAAQAIRKVYDIGWKPTHFTPEYKEWLAWMKKYNSSANVADAGAVYGYSVAQTMVAVLKARGDDLTRENIMKRAASIHDLKLPMLLPGITPSTSGDDFAPIKQMQLQKFDGVTWKLFGEVISGSGS